jgi:RimJ/RimL family protein N-acetyltransferase
MAARMPDGRPLTGSVVRLDAVRPEDADDLFRALDDEQVWAAGYNGGPASRPATAGQLADGFPKPTERVQYVVRLAVESVLGAAGTVVGTSSLGEVVLADERAHLGWTAYSPTVWGTTVNPECKLLMLRHAFEDCGFGRVKIQTDAINLRSQAAIAKLGAVREGVLRRHKARGDGTFRDTVVFSILAAEWPAVAQRLRDRIAG